jgi:serine phosphatase RsbU (regulator of sigma subunit)/pSer/pThr/pTyr-binding forkhead associated (FHA) protein
MISLELKNLSPVVMSHSYCVLLLGIVDPAVPRSHFGKAGILVREAGSLTRDSASLNDQDLDAIYLQPSEDARAAEELRQTLECRPDLPVVLVCTQPSVRLTREVWHAGAADILVLPLTPESLDESLRHAARRKVNGGGPKADEIQARFHYFDDDGKERWVAVVPPKLTIGRSSDNDLAFSKMNVSRSHAEVLVQDGDCYLRDLGSKHGTYVNGIRIERTLLTHGDHIRLGGLQGEALTFHKGDLLHSLLAGSEPNAESRFAVRGFREMGMLLSTFQALSSIPLLDDLLNLVVDTAIELTGAERGFIMLKEEDGSLSFRCARNSDKKSLEKTSFRTSRRVPEEAFQTGKRIVINDLEVGDEPESHASTRKLGVRSISCVPLRYVSIHDSIGLSGIASMEIIGVLYVDSVNVGSGLSSSQIEAFDTLASEAAQAIYRARLYKAFREKQKMEEELAIAREIQQALLPPRDKTLPFVDACSLNLPCREVGGDYFDYFDLDGGRLGFALGDVAGKGMPAALLAAMLQGIFCAQTLLNLPLPSMIANVNCSLARRGTGSRFVTFFFGILDSEGTCTYTNAGHNPPLLVRPDGSLEELTEGGMVLGLFAQAQYISKEVKLEPGDHLVLFTDGVVEALNLAGEEFGQQRLCDALKRNVRASAPDMLRSLKDDLIAFSANAPQHDDITMMVLGFRENPGI